jgi:hypothetical protein
MKKIVPLLTMCVLLVTLAVALGASGSEPELNTAIQALLSSESQVRDLDVEWTILANVADLEENESTFGGTRFVYRYARQGVSEYIRSQRVTPDGTVDFDEETVWNGFAGNSLLHHEKPPVFIVTSEKPGIIGSVRIPGSAKLLSETFGSVLANGSGRYVGEESVDGVLCKKYSAHSTKSTATEIDVWLDPSKDYMCRKFRCAYPKYYDEVTTVTSAQQVGGVWVPMRWWYEHTDQVKDEVHRGIMLVRNVMAGDQVDDSLFKLPVPAGAKIEDRVLNGG